MWLVRFGVGIKEGNMRREMRLLFRLGSCGCICETR